MHYQHKQKDDEQDHESLACLNFMSLLDLPSMASAARNTTVTQDYTQLTGIRSERDRLQALGDQMECQGKLHLALHYYDLCYELDESLQHYH